MRRAVRLLTCCLALALAMAPRLAGAGPDIVLRAVSQVDRAWVGQQVPLEIEVLSADGWAQIVDFGDVVVPGAYVLPNSSQGSRSQTTINGRAYTGQRYTLWLFPQRQGRLSVPALPVKARVKQWGAGAGDAEYELKTPPLALEVRLPPGVADGRGLISTTRLTADQTWAPDSLDLELGAAVERRVKLAAADVSGMVFVPLEQPADSSLGIYPGLSEVQDRIDRGTLTGQRTESVSYVLLRPGKVVIPPVVVQWWDVKNEKLRRTTLPGRTLQVRGEWPPAPLVAGLDSATGERRGWSVPLLVVCALIGLLGLGRPARRWLRQREATRRESEAAYFRRALHTIGEGDAVAITNNVLRWLDRLADPSQTWRLDDFLVRYGDEASRAAAAKLARRVADRQPFGEGKALRVGLRQARQQYLAARKRRILNEVLPSLNGTGQR